LGSEAEAEWFASLLFSRALPDVLQMVLFSENENILIINRESGAPVSIYKSTLAVQKASFKICFPNNIWRGGFLSLWGQNVGS
jgi:hypothetical protein